MNYNEAIENGESNKVEFKSTLRVNRELLASEYIEHNAMKTIAAFLNSDGGMLIIGIDKNKNILGIEDDLNSFSSEDKKDQFLLYFDNIMEKYLGNRFYRYLDSRFVEIDNKTIFVVLVKSKSSEPTFLHSEKGDLFYIRRSASTVELKIKDATKYIGKSTEIDPLSPA